MREESSFYPEVKSSANAFGLMQLIVPTATWVAAGTPYGHDETALKTPEANIGLGVRLLGKLQTKHAHRALAIGAYNGGSGAVDRGMRARGNEELDVFVEHIPWEETRNYVKRVLSSQAAYAYLEGEAAFDRFLALPLGLPH
jgi:soluble lytic murein transglycosylase